MSNLSAQNLSLVHNGTSILYYNYLKIFFSFLGNLLEKVTFYWWLRLQSQLSIFFYDDEISFLEHLPRILFSCEQQTKVEKKSVDMVLSKSFWISPEVNCLYYIRVYNLRVPLYFNLWFVYFLPYTVDVYRYKTIESIWNSFVTLTKGISYRFYRYYL